MDPWVDFVGVPRPLKRRDGKTVLELVRRPELVDEEVDALFIDEFNRAPAKVRNAAMELLQFQSVNGHRFNRLKTVWAAINPGDEEYDTDRLDPAQLDRFHVHIDVPWRPCPDYFIREFGSAGRAALEWWDLQVDEAKNKISPRRLEYALRTALLGGPVRDVLPQEANVRKFLQLMQEGPIFDKLRDLHDRGDREGARELMQDPDTGSRALRHIVGSKVASAFFLPFLDPERLMALLANKDVLDTVVRYAGNVPEFHNVLASLFLSEAESPLKKQARALAKKHGVAVCCDRQPALVPTAGELGASAMRDLDPYGRIAR
jgi:hypothetical protein